jgi:ABC-type antimicrobial peptide transport system permease subunit
VLATLAGSLAAALLIGGIRALTVRFFGSVPPTLNVDGWMIAACAGLCLITTLMFGLIPAIRFSRPNVLARLKDEVGGGGRRVGRVHRLAAAVQLGIAVPFLVAGGVLLDHMRTTATAELGFEEKGLIAAPVNLTGPAGSAELTAVLLRTAREHLAQTSGVTSVGIADGLPLDFRSRSARVSRQDDTTPVFVRQTRVDEGYRSTMGIRLVRGRDFTPQDRAGAELVAMIAEPIAVRLFPHSDALGQRLTVTFADRTVKVVTIVGVIADLVGAQISTPRGEMLLPLAQHPASTVFLIARGSEAGGSTALAPAFQTALRDLNPDFNVSFASRHPGYLSSLVTGETLVENSIRDTFSQSRPAFIGGGVALILAALGVYGVVGFMLAARTREMAVRTALGATHARLLRRIFIDVAKLVAPGVAAGLAVAIFVVRVSYLSWYALGGVEPLVYAVAVGIAVAVALIASLPAARRAASVDPIAAMRTE